MEVEEKLCVYTKALGYYQQKAIRTNLRQHMEDDQINTTNGG